MGYNQNYAGIHPVPHNYKGRTDIVDTYDKYGAMLAEHNIKYDDKRKSFIEDIQLYNSVVIIKKKGSIKSCTCGGKLNYREDIKICYQSDEKMRTVQIVGKKCIDCGFKIVLEEELLQKLQLKI